MNEEKITAKTTAEAAEGAENAVSTEEAISTAEFSDDMQTDKADDKSEDKPKQSKEQNSENARRRREAEQKEAIRKAEEAARQSAIIEVLGGKNPYTGDEIKDKADIDEYLVMKEIDSKGGDPLADYAKVRKEKEKQLALENEKKEQESAWFKNDRESFASKYPDVDVSQIISDPMFAKYADGKVGVKPLAEIYEGFLELTSEYEKKANNKARQIVANGKASPGTLSSTQTPEGFFTKEQVQKMSAEEVHKNYDEIRKSMTKWK